MDSTSEIDNELAEGALFEQVQVAATSPITINAGSNPPKSSAEREAELRRSLLDIQNDTSLDPREKAKRMQRPASRTSELSQSAGSTVSSTLGQEDEGELAALMITEEDRTPSFYTKVGLPDSEKYFGCTHYRTNCKIRAECCGNWYCCRFCHDEAEDHPIDRYYIKFILCLFCQSPQRAHKHCHSCHKSLANYHCSICNLWDDDPHKQIFHCEQCRICRRGRREDYIHCDRCGGCIASSHFPEHKCRDGSLDSNCPICSDNLFSTTTPVQFMPCGHAIHFWCLQDYTKNSYQCPICLKSIGDMSHFFHRIDEVMASQKMPEEYAKVKSLILCNDCEKKSVVPFHFIYHRCDHCRSYNTKPLTQINEDNQAIDPPPPPTPSDLQ